MRVLVLGSGGREHALVWKLGQSPHVRVVFCAPGNGGIEQDARCIRLAVQDADVVADFARKEKIDFIIVGPEGPLAAGIADEISKRGIPILGPSLLAARLESSKVFAKRFMVRHRIPTAPFAVHADPQSAIRQLESAETRFPIVVKADGLAAGKGVVVARDIEEARGAVERIMIRREFGAAGDQVIIEECLEGTEASFFAFTDGEAIVPTPPAQDHKAVYDNDRGPNTGGMGTFSADAILTPELQDEILGKIVRPVIDGMRSEGTPFRGILYAGLMLTSRGPQVLEFNVRLGDPECQVILPRLESDFAQLCESLCGQRLRSYKAAWKSNAAVCVVLASGGYPGEYRKGKVISGIEMALEDPHVMVFHSGTRREIDHFITDGGRVLGVTAVASDLASAIMSAYDAVNKIRFEDMHYRRDIGARGLQMASR